MDSYIQIKKSQSFLIKETPIYMKTSEDRFLLYKAGKKDLDSFLFLRNILPDLYIHIDDKKKAIKEIINSLNIELYRQIKKNGLLKVKDTMIQLFNEVVNNAGEDSLDALPETIELLFNEYSDKTDFIIKLAEISNNDNSFVEHSVNVMFFVMNYCIHCGYSESDVKRLSLCGLLHDIGKIKLPGKICNAEHFLSEDEFEIYRAHPILGNVIIKKYDAFDDSIAIAALEHHENLNGSGYPKEIANISFEGQLVGMTDSFEQLVYEEKKYRKAKCPFDAMSIIKNETLETGKYSKELFKDFCMSLSQ